MTTKARLSTLAKALDKPATSTKKADGLVANREHGDKGDHIKVTVTLPPAVYELIMQEVTRRKMGKESNPAISAVLREAAVKYLSK